MSHGNLRSQKTNLRNKKLSESSQRWLRRQLSDPFTLRAQQIGYRSRAAFKLLELQEKFHIFSSDSVVLDLGAAPGGWCQIARRFVDPKKGLILGVDLLELGVLSGVTCLQGDLCDAKTQQLIRSNLTAYGMKVDVLLSDMAPSMTGQKTVDALKHQVLMEMAYDYVVYFLKEGGVFVMKTLQSGPPAELMQLLKNSFSYLKMVKPKASRLSSSEMYLVARGYRSSQTKDLF
jgi:23S rRNA (uridine2552-2'-O)-methyltransferase